MNKQSLRAMRVSFSGGELEAGLNEQNGASKLEYSRGHYFFRRL